MKARSAYGVNVAQVLLRVYFRLEGRLELTPLQLLPVNWLEESVGLDLSGILA